MKHWRREGDRERENFFSHYLSKAGCTRGFHLVFLAEVLVVGVEDGAREAGPGHHLIVLSQPAKQKWE